MAWISPAAHFWILEHTDHFLCWLLTFGLFVVDDLGFQFIEQTLCPPDSPKFYQLWLCASECLSVERDEKKCIFTGTGVKSVALEWCFLMSWLVIDNLMIHWFWNTNFHSCIMKFVLFVVWNQSFNVYYAVFHFWCLVFASGRQKSLLHLVHLFVHYFHVFIML